MGCVGSRHGEHDCAEEIESSAEHQSTDIVVSTAGDFILTAASCGPVDHEQVDRARRRFEFAYQTLLAPERRFNSDAQAYFYARCVLNAYRSGNLFIDAAPSSVVDGVHRRFVTRRVSV